MRSSLSTVCHASDDESKSDERDFCPNLGNPLIGEFVKSCSGVSGLIVDYENDDIIQMYSGNYIVLYSDGSPPSSVLFEDFVSQSTADANPDVLDVGHVILVNASDLFECSETPPLNVLMYREAWNTLTDSPRGSSSYTEAARMITKLSCQTDYRVRRHMYDYTGTLSKAGRIRRRDCPVELVRDWKIRTGAK